MPVEQSVRGKSGHCNLFFLLYPDDETRERAAGLAQRIKRRDRLTGPLMAKSRLHVSLNGLNRWPAPPQRLIAHAKAAASRVRMRPFKVDLDRIEQWQGPVVALGDESTFGVRLLRTEIHEALAEAGVVLGPEKGFTPHLTLLRDQHGIAGEFIPPLSWTVREFVLVGSAHGEGRHDIFGRWPLIG